MTMHIDDVQFRRAHTAFERYMLSYSLRPGISFRNFQHPFLVEDEIRYKWGVFDRATDILSRPKWTEWRSKTPAKIVDVVKAACQPSVTKNLLEHRFGPQSSSEAALYRVTIADQVSSLGIQLFDFFWGGGTTPDEVGPRFDCFVDYLKRNHLGPGWPFLAYLLFLLDCTRYFPVRPTHFDALLHFYGIQESISGHVSWERYSLLLELADVLRNRLARFGPADAIAIQSYMWVVSNLILRKEVTPDVPMTAPDFDAEYKARAESAKRSAQENERIGIQGEKFVFELEKERLRKAGRDHLVDRVEMKSFARNEGYDILSFQTDGTEIHIEVKTTASSPKTDNGFWLSENERQTGEEDRCWVVYRVWNIDSAPTWENLGNPVRDRSRKWQITASTWYVRQGV